MLFVVSLLLWSLSICLSSSSGSSSSSSSRSSSRSSSSSSSSSSIIIATEEQVRHALPMKRWATPPPASLWARRGRGASTIIVRMSIRVNVSIRISIS